MKPRKPDRWERSVSKYTAPGVFLGSNARDLCLSGKKAADLLRREHQWMVRMVKVHLATWDTFPPRGLESDQYGWDCRVAQCRDILNSLQQRRK